MTAGRWVTAAAVVVLMGALAWLLFIVLPKWYGSGDGPAAPPASAGPAAPAPAPKVRATLFFVGEDGASLVPAEREIPFGSGTLELGRHILEAEFASPPAPLLPAAPAGTALRALYLDDHGRAYVDLSAESAAAHPGGSLYERLTVAAIVEALTVNLPAISEVQILVGGREVDTLAGHVDLRRPWTRHALWPQSIEAPSAAAGAMVPPGRD